MQDQSADWPHGDRDGLTGEGQSEREAAVAAAQRLLSAPGVRVPRPLLRALLGLLREAERVLEAVLNEASAGARHGADDRAAERE